MNNSPKSAMNPVVQVHLGKVHTIRIPMADTDGDPVRCRWGQKNKTECGSICSPKGFLTRDPCELTYNATRLGYTAVALIIEDFDSNNEVISSIPLQFLIHIVNKTVDPEITDGCDKLPVYVGDQPSAACIGVESNKSMAERVQFRIPCANTSTTLVDILTISPPGMTKGPIIQDSFDSNLYSMEFKWTPQPDQYGVHQLCLMPVDSQQQMGAQICLTFQVDILPPQIIAMHPMGLVPKTQSTWMIELDRDIVSPGRSSGINIHFFRRSNNEEVFGIDMASNPSVLYERRKIIFFTTGYTWDEVSEHLSVNISTMNWKRERGVRSNRPAT